ncbi:hypothetical protein BZARG_833 [Bizionia argentinensis JUB59]|uniref:Peptidase M1 membrane alanine aminopeptidase domain-containing protein n=1 Tax=Bizionia argentinensis JUB59 TaxID=1046627 RepID=G2EBE9_9FLAO|nr:hypothetical protein [Bizionia argentinensis]EGV44344.1 hypothetical protein BZARG_833 [Bizionia argentinensis JUB59]
MKKTAYIIIVLGFINISFSQPHITGTVTLDIEKGFIHCDFTLSNLPKLSKYKILLNHGMNIKYFKNNEDQVISYNGYYDGKTNGEGLEYYFVNEQNEQIELNNKFKIEYSGAYPVYKDSLNGFDFKGYIAINDKTLRATEQSKWYPIIYDVQNDRLLTNYTYKITVNTINKPQSVFLNGTQPKKGIKTLFSSTKSVPLFLFAGDFDFSSTSGNYLINADVSENTAEKIFDNIESIKEYYENLLEINFNDQIYIINHNAVKALKNNDWGFNSYPAFGFSNLDFNELLAENNKFKENHYKFFAHELAHNYFGNNVNSGVLSWFWLEATAEYLSLVVLEDYTNKENVAEYYEYYINTIENKNFIPLANITDNKQIDSEYRYILGPLIFKAFEISFGKEKTIETLKSLLVLSENQKLTINSWEKSATQSGISKEAFIHFKDTFLLHKRFKINITNLITDSYKNKN